MPDSHSWIIDGRLDQWTDPSHTGKESIIGKSPRRLWVPQIQSNPSAAQTRPTHPDCGPQACSRFRRQDREVTRNLVRDWLLIRRGALSPKTKAGGMQRSGCASLVPVVKTAKLRKGNKFRISAISPSQELLPRDLPVLLQCRFQAVLLENVGNGAARNLMAQIVQRPLYSSVAPIPVLGCHATINLSISSLVRGRPGPRWLLPSYFLAMSLRCQARRVSSVTIAGQFREAGAARASSPWPPSAGADRRSGGGVWLPVARAALGFLRGDNRWRRAVAGPTIPQPKPAVIETGRRSCALAKDSSEDCRSWICKYYDLKQIQFMDTTRCLIPQSRTRALTRYALYERDVNIKQHHEISSYPVVFEICLWSIGFGLVLSVRSFAPECAGIPLIAALVVDRDVCSRSRWVLCSYPASRSGCGYFSCC
jgi:hypothetical protein